jgi:DNA-binding MarR family transcriptional regulator
MKSTSETINQLLRLAFSLQSQHDQILQEQLGIGYAQYKILMVVRDNPASDQLAVASALAQTQAGISRQVKLLSRMNLIDIKVDRNDRRRHILKLTSEGLRMLVAAGSAIDRFNDKLTNLTDKQLQQLAELLGQLH